MLPAATNPALAIVSVAVRVTSTDPWMPLSGAVLSLFTSMVDAVTLSRPSLLNSESEIWTVSAAVAVRVGAVPPSGVTERTLDPFRTISAVPLSCKSPCDSRSTPSISMGPLSDVAVSAPFERIRGRAEAPAFFLKTSLPSARMVISPALAAASPRKRTPTPASVPISLIRSAYIPPSAEESIPNSGFPLGLSAFGVAIPVP